MVLPESEAGSSPVSDSGDVVVIAHDRRVQAAMDQLNIAWGTQYEISRGVSDGRWSWDKVTVDKLKKLRGTNSEVAHRVAAVLLDTAQPSQSASNHKLW